MKIPLVAEGTISDVLGQNMMQDGMSKRMCVYVYVYVCIYVCMYDWVTMLYSRD